MKYFPWLTLVRAVRKLRCAAADKRKEKLRETQYIFIVFISMTENLADEQDEKHITREILYLS